MFHAVPTVAGSFSNNASKLENLYDLTPDRIKYREAQIGAAASSVNKCP
jgi:hypothetical protein